ncbi:unnamed protein product, partial [Prorocentrum cordatum]
VDAMHSCAAYRKYWGTCDSNLNVRAGVSSRTCALCSDSFFGTQLQIDCDLRSLADQIQMAIRRNECNGTFSTTTEAKEHGQ